MNPTIQEKTVFNVTENGLTEAYVTDASYEELIKWNEHADTKEELQTILKVAGYQMQKQRPSIHINFDKN